MITFESPIADESSGTSGESFEEAKVRPERDPELAALWRKYRFLGDPPFLGSPAEARLKDLRKRYLQLVLLDKPSLVNRREDAEDYFAQFRRGRESDSSEAIRRELHNQIALMVLGRQRSGMETSLAEAIGEFASELTYGVSVEEAIERKKRNKI